MKTLIEGIFLTIFIASSIALGIYIVKQFIYCVLPIWLKLIIVIMISLGVLIVLD